MKKYLRRVRSEYLVAMLNNDTDAAAKQQKLVMIRKIVGIIKTYPEQISDGKQLKSIKGIGKKTIDRVNEIIKNGYLEELKNPKYDKQTLKQIRSIEELEDVIGIGPKTAAKFIKKYKIGSVDDLKVLAKKGKVKLTDQIKLGLKYHGIYQENIPRKETEKIKAYLQKTIKKIDKKLELHICGSYRRGREVSGDIDVLIFHPDLNSHKNMDKIAEYLVQIVNALSENNFLLDHLTDPKSGTKYMGFSQLEGCPVRRIDIRMLPYESYYTALLYFTGPFELNAYMRDIAKKMGLLLNEYGLYQKKKDKLKTIPIDSEETVFKKLGLKPLAPDERDRFMTIY
jgi:DNA polymerase beta